MTAPAYPPAVERALERLSVIFLLGAGFSIAVEQWAAIVLVLVWLCTTLVRRLRPPLPLIVPIVAFLASAVLSSVLALDPGLAFRQLRTEWAAPLLWIVVAGRPTGTAVVLRRIDVMTLVGAAMVVVGLVQTLRFGLTFRIDGTFATYMTYAGVLLQLALPILAAVLFQAGSRRDPRTWIRVGVLVAIVVALLLSQTRGAWLGAFAGVAVLVALWRARWLAALPVAAIVLFALAPPAARGRILDLVERRDVTSTERFYMWRSSIDMLRDHPVAGVGLDNFRTVIGAYRLPDAPWAPERPLSHAHSNPFMLAAERGLVGVATWCAVWLAWLVAIWRTWRGLPAGDRVARGVVAGSIAAVVAFHVSGLTEYTWGDTEVAYLAAFVTGSGLAYGTRRERALSLR